MHARCFIALLFAVLLSQVDAAAQPRKIVIDCDPGIDDATAIVLAMQHAGFEIVGISTMFGNADVDQATRNALTIVELSGRAVPVYRGRPDHSGFRWRRHQISFTGKMGWETRINHSRGAPRSRNQPHSSSSISQGPSRVRSRSWRWAGSRTSAEAIRLDSSFTSNVREVVVMGGAFHVPGNVSPVAEANISGDPDAADIVLAGPWKVTMLALNTTTKVKLNDEILRRVRDQNERFGPFIWSINRFYQDFHKNMERVEGGAYVHDPSAIMHPSTRACSRSERCPVRVVTRGHRDRRDDHAGVQPPTGTATVARQARRDDGDGCRRPALLDTFEAVMTKD